MLPSLEKNAGGELIARLARWGATPIRHTPKLFMKLRNKGQLDSLEAGIRGGIEKRVDKPFEGLLRKGKVDKAVEHSVSGISRASSWLRHKPGSPEARQALAKKVADKTVRLPPHLFAAHASPVPGLGLIAEAVEHGKKLVLNHTPGLPMLAKTAFDQVMLSAFSDELEKIAASTGGGKPLMLRAKRVFKFRKPLSRKVKRVFKKKLFKRIHKGWHYGQNVGGGSGGGDGGSR